MICAVKPAPPRSARSRPAGRRELIERAFDGWSGDAADKAAEGAKAVGHKCGPGGALKSAFRIRQQTLS